MYKLVSQVYKIAPGVLTEHGKSKHDLFPNLHLLLGGVDAHPMFHAVHPYHLSSTPTSEYIC